MPVGGLVERLGQSQPKVSNHLACLRWCGFVETRREHPSVYYRIADDRVGELLALGNEPHGVGDRAVAREGAAVAVADINLAAAQSTAAQIEQAGGRAVALQVDLGDEASVTAMVNDAAQALGGTGALSLGAPGAGLGDHIVIDFHTGCT